MKISIETNRGTIELEDFTIGMGEAVQYNMKFTFKDGPSESVDLGTVQKTDLKRLAKAS